MVKSSVKSHDILLESGTNELEIITFSLSWVNPENEKKEHAVYGINAAKVKELVAMPDNDEITELPDSPDSVLGVFLLRGNTIPLVDLCRWFRYQADMSEDTKAQWVVIVTEINGRSFGFITHGVDSVYRVSWTQIQPPPEIIAESRSITGVCLADDHIIQMVDFESIAAAVDPSMLMDYSRVAKEGGHHITKGGAPEGKFVVIADDSRFILGQVRKALEGSGYPVKSHSDGQAAWEYLKGVKERGAVDKEILAVVSDIEMPRMDGHHLCLRIKEDPAFKGIPVILFSSLINKALFHKGEAVGADAQITKMDLGVMVTELENCLQKYLAA